jgi:hypothetical protein
LVSFIELSQLSRVTHDDMVVLCDGMVRSGSTWSFNAALNLLRCDSRPAYGLYSEERAVLAAAVRPRRSHLIIKSHALDPHAQGLCRGGRLRAIFTWRDPYDVVISCVRMFGRTPMHWIYVVRDSLRAWAFHRATNTAHIVSYERLVTEPEEEIGAIAAYLGLPVPPERIGELARRLSFGRMKHLAQHVHELPAPRLVRTEADMYDRETLLHPHHLRNGGTGYGVKALRDEERTELEAVLRDEGFDFLCASPGGRRVSTGALGFFQDANVV